MKQMLTPFYYHTETIATLAQKIEEKLNRKAAVLLFDIKDGKMAGDRGKVYLMFLDTSAIQARQHSRHSPRESFD